MSLRMGVDLGGTKIEIAVFDENGREILRRRAPTPRAGYDVALEAFASLILEAEKEAGAPCRVGIGMPGTAPHDAVLAPPLGMKGLGLGIAGIEIGQRT